MDNLFPKKIIHDFMLVEGPLQLLPRVRLYPTGAPGPCWDL